VFLTDALKSNIIRKYQEHATVVMCMALNIFIDKDRLIVEIGEEFIEIKENLTFIKN
jgi:hypothetical protein